MAAKSKTPVFIFLVFLFFLISSGFIFAQRPLEVDYPQIGTERPETTAFGLPNYIRYVFNLSLGIAGFVVFVVLVYSGFKYLTSTGNAPAMSDAKDRIFSALLGMIFLLGSWLLLTTINPQLIIVTPEYKPSGLTAGALPGVYLCRNSSAQIGSADCRVFTASMTGLGSFNDQVGYIRFLNPAGTPAGSGYGTILHENGSFEGTCQIFLAEGPVGPVTPTTPDRTLPANSRPSSITVFRQRTGNGGAGATVYEDREFGGGYYNFGIGENRDFGPPPPNPAPLLYNNCTPSGGPFGGRTCLVENTVSSIRVNSGYMAVLFGDDNFGGRCQAFFRENSSLSDDYIGSDQASSIRVFPVQ